MVQKVLFKEWEVTRDRVREYAQQCFFARATYTEAMWDEEKRKLVDVVKTNSVHHELCCVFGRWLYESLVQYSKADLINDLHAAYMNGSSKPIEDMTEDELIEEIWTEIIQPAMECEPDFTWENFLRDTQIWPLP